MNISTSCKIPLTLIKFETVTEDPYLMTMLFLVEVDFRLLKIRVSLIREPAYDGIMFIFFLGRR